MAEDAKDAPWAQKYAKSYVTVDEENKPLKAPPHIPGTRLITDSFGVTHVVFTESQTEPKLAKPDVLVASRMEGSEADSQCILIPVWAGNTGLQSASSSVLPCGLYYDLFNPASSIRNDANNLTATDRHLDISSHDEEQITTVFLSVGGVQEHDLAAALYGIILTIQPTEKKPLEITLRPTSWEHDKLNTFVVAKGWKKKEYGLSLIHI